MSRHIDADALAYKVASNGDADFINKVTKLMIEVPSIDIVRCKECIHRLEEGRCVRWLDDDYCSYGEREDK